MYNIPEKKRKLYRNTLCKAKIPQYYQILIKLIKKKKTSSPNGNLNRSQRCPLPGVQHLKRILYMNVCPVVTCGYNVECWGCSFGGFQCHVSSCGLSSIWLSTLVSVTYLMPRGIYTMLYFRIILLFDIFFWCSLFIYCIAMYVLHI